MEQNQGEFHSWGNKQSIHWAANQEHGLPAMWQAG
jgi:hypothetical protein